jgi:hypothetical protein
LTGALVLAGVVLAVVDPTSSTIAFAAVGTVGALCAGLGLVVARTVRQNPVGALLTLIGFGVAFTATREIGERVVARHPDTLAQLGVPAALLEESSVWLLVTLALLLLYFPNGHVPGPRWRPLPPLLVVTGFIHHAYGAVASAPFAPPLDHLARPWDLRRARSSSWRRSPSWPCSRW